MAARLGFACAALLLSCLPGLAGASPGAGLFSAPAQTSREAIAPAPPRPLLGGAAGRAVAPHGHGEALHGGGLPLGGPSRPAQLRSRVAQVDLGQLESARLGVGGLRPARLGLNLFADAQFEAVLERSAPTASGYTLAGRLEGDPLSTVVLAVNGGWVAGTVWSGDGRWAVRPLGGGVAEVAQLDPSALGRCGVGLEPAGEPAGLPSSDTGPPSPARSSGAAASAQSAPMSEALPEDDGSVIDVLVVYPTFARRSAGGHLGMRALIEGDVALTNKMYQDSGAVQRINLVGAVELRRRPELERSRKMPDYLDRLQDGSDGHMDEVHALRDNYAADMVLMHWGHLVGLGRGLTIGALAGVAYQMDDLSGDYAPEAFVVANTDAFAHELGHAMGLRHERYSDVGNTPFPYSHGYYLVDGSPGLPPERDGRGMATVMVAGRGEPWGIPRFSNPSLRYPDGSGPAIGVPGDAPSDSADGPADAVRSLNGTRRVVANFRRSASRCRYELSPPAGPLPASGGEFRIGVRAGSGCAWSAFSNDGHVSVAEGAGGIGDGEVAFRLSANGGWERGVSVFVAGEAYLAEQATAKERRTTPVCERSFGVRRAIEKAAGKACGEVTASDLASIRVLNAFDDDLFQLEAPSPIVFGDERRHLPAGSFDGMTGLVSLDLKWGGHKLGVLEPGFFDGLVRLRLLDLRKNDFTVLRAGVLEGAPNLARLHLGDELETLEPGAFRGLSNIEELRLEAFRGNEGVGLTELRAGAFEGLSNLRELYVHAPAAGKVEAGAFEGLSNLRELYLHGFGRVSELPSGLFDGLASLPAFRLEGFGRVSELPSDLLDGLASLENFGLVGFGRVSELPAGLLDGLAGLNGLGLVGFGRVSELPSGLFDGLGALEVLRLRETGLRSLDPGTFSGLSRLRYLYLSDNQLAAVHPRLFRGLRGLRGVHLDGNRLTALDGGLFDGLRDERGLNSSMWRVDLARNRLARLGPGLFRGMERLANLELQGNRLAALPPRLFEGLHDLVRLDLSGNPGAPFAFRPEFARLPAGASGADGAAEVALELPPAAAFDLCVGLSAAGGALSADRACVRIGRIRGEAVAVRPDGDGPVTVRMEEAFDVPGIACTDLWGSYPPCLMGVRVELGAPLVLRGLSDQPEEAVGAPAAGAGTPVVLSGLSDQALAPGGAVRFDLAGAFPDFPEGTAYAAESGAPAVAEAAVEGGLLTVAAAGVGVASVTVAATAPDGRSATLTFTVTVERTPGSLWGGWRSALLRPPPADGGDGA